jgi:outer membrane biosynthesis protein TonB
MIEIKSTKNNNWIAASFIAISSYGFILGIGYLLTDTPETWRLSNQTPVMEEMEVAFEDEALAEMKQEQNEAESKTSEAVRDLLASSDAQQVSDLVNYTGEESQGGNATQSGADAAKSFSENTEKELFTKHESHGVQLPTTHSNQQKEKELSNTQISGGNTSYSGNVSATFSLSGRSVKSAPKPTYKCKGAGQVVVLISVNELGYVSEAKIDANQSSKDACLLNESLTYALKWRFSEGKNSKQPGVITFQFSAQ